MPAAPPQEPYRMPNSVSFVSETSNNQKIEQNNTNLNPKDLSNIDRRATMIKQREMEKSPAYNDAAIATTQQS